MGEVTIEIQNGGLGLTSENTDKYTGLIIEVGVLPVGWVDNAVKEVANMQALEALGVEETGLIDCKHIWYHANEFFRLAPDALLFIMLTTDVFSAAKLSAITDFNDNIRLIGYNSAVTVVGVTQIDALQTKAKAMFDDAALPVRVVFSGTLSTIDPSTATDGADRVLYDCVQDITVGSLALAVHTGNSGQCGATGTWLGLYAGRPVHQKPSWVQTGDISGLNWSDYAFVDVVGTSIKNYTQTQIDAKAAIGINIPRKYPRSTGTYMSDGRSSTLSTNDFKILNYGRVIDKASVLVYDATLPSVDRPAYVDATTGKLTPDTIEYLRAVAYNAIQDNMIGGKSGNNVELSVDGRTGRLQIDAITIDPAQNVISTEKIEIIIGLVPVGSSKTISIKIGLRNPAIA